MSNSKRNSSGSSEDNPWKLGNAESGIFFMGVVPLGSSPIGNSRVESEFSPLPSVLLSSTGLFPESLNLSSVSSSSSTGSSVYSGASSFLSSPSTSSVYWSICEEYWICGLRELVLCDVSAFEIISSMKVFLPPPPLPPVKLGFLRPLMHLLFLKRNH